jgi:hypothetical protein
MSKAHFDAVDALIPTDIKRWRGSAPDKPTEDDYPYVVLGGNSGTETGDSYAGDTDTLEPRFKLTYAGLTFDSVLIIQDRVRAALRDRRLVIPGWTTGRLHHESLMDIRTDFDVTVPEISLHPQFAVDEFTVMSGR